MSNTLTIEFSNPRAVLSEDGQTINVTVTSSRPDVTGAEMTFHYTLADLIGTTWEDLTEQHRRDLIKHLQAPLLWGPLGPKGQLETE